VGSDRARISFDKTREYRSVVAQQGRVTLEADVNEEVSIASEALRYETIDIIGPTGTPDNGYLVSLDSAGNLTVGSGIMYVGGWRMRFTQDVPVVSQPEWLDQPLETEQQRGIYVIALLVTEQEVQAVEDQALREVALGGPDTGARTRLMQHLVAVSTQDDTCAAALKDWDNTLAPIGLILNPRTLALDFSDATLEVSFYPPAGPVDPCCPPAQGGFLGADNQLIRVTVTSYDSTTNTGTLLWGWNNASFLYRATLVDPTANPQILTLSPAPVDSAHTPQVNQVIEVLRSTMQLGNPVDLNFIAAPEGEVITLGNASPVFDTTTNQLTLPAGPPLAAAYASDTNPLFVRLWQAEIPFTGGTSTDLDDVSGLAVTINMTALPSGPLEARPFWDFAVRPNTPQQVYPQRFLESAQPPTGPRRWLTDLAIVEYIPSYAPGRLGGYKVLADCRVSFNPLTGLGDDDGDGCCGITLNPAQVTAAGGLQAVVDAQAMIGQSLSLRPGRYVLEAPLALTRAHAGFVLSGCNPGSRTRLTVDPSAIASFTAGMITVTDTSYITIQGLSFAMPLTPVAGLTAPIGNPVTGQTLSADMTIGIGLQNAGTILIEDCDFVYPSPQDTPGDILLYVGAGIYASENCSGMRVLRNRFQCSSGGNISKDFRYLIGVAMSPSSLDTQNSTGGSGGQTSPQPQSPAPAQTTAQQAAAGVVILPVVNDQLDDVEIADNRFTGLSIAVFAVAEFGMIRCTDNRAVNCCGGFFFLESDMGGNTAFGQAALADEKQGGNNLASASLARQVMQPVLLANAVNFTAAMRPTAAAQQPPSSTVSDETRGVLVSDSNTHGQAAYTSFLSGQTSAAANDQNNNEPAAAPAADAAPALSDTDYENASAAYSVLQSVGIARELNGTTLVPAIYIRDNDAELVPYDTTAKNPASLQGIRCMLALSTDKGALFISGNRIEVPNGYSIAVSSEWGASSILTGNSFNQKGVTNSASEPCAYLVTTDRAFSAIAGNVVNATWSVTPPRSGIPATTDWRFLNTVL
jgi:Family of unknown function (DUF6519)